MNTTLWTLWCACGFVGWMGAEVLNCEEDSDLTRPRNERDPVANLCIFLTDIFLAGLFFGPMLLAVVVRRWVKK